MTFLQSLLFLKQGQVLPRGSVKTSQSICPPYPRISLFLGHLNAFHPSFEEFGKILHGNVKILLFAYIHFSESCDDSNQIISNLELEFYIRDAFIVETIGRTRSSEGNSAKVRGKS